MRSNASRDTNRTQQGHDLFNFMVTLFRYVKDSAAINPEYVEFCRIVTTSGKIVVSYDPPFANKKLYQEVVIPWR